VRPRILSGGAVPRGAFAAAYSLTHPNHTLPTMPNARRWSRTLGRTLLLAALTAAGACRGDSGEKGAAAAGGADEGTPERGGTAILAEIAEMNKPLPFLYETGIDSDLIDIMFMPLLRGGWRDGRQVFMTADESPMALARRWEYVGPDSTGIRYHMRSDVKWSDGRPVTARDVVWTYDMVRDPKVASPRSDQVEQMDSVVAQDDSTVTFYFKRRYPDMLFHSGLPISPRHPFEGSDPAQIRTHPAMVDPSGRLPVSGAFRVGRWDRTQQVVLVPNPHFRPEPRLDQIVVRFIPEATTRLTELLRGAVDFMRPVPHDKIAEVRSRAPNVRFEREEKRFFDFIGYNPKVEPFGDRDVRLALGLAIDVPGILKGLNMQDYAVAAGGPYSPIFRELYDPRQQAPLRNDPARARQILESKGWQDADGDGVREKNGKPLRFTLLINAGNPRKEAVAQIVQQQWKQVGVDAKIQMLEFNTFWDRQMQKKFDAVVGNWGVGLSPDIVQLWGKDAPLNFVSYDNPRTFALFEQAQAQPTEQQALPYWRAAAAQIVADQPYTFLYYFDQVDGVSSRLRGMRIDTYGAFQNSWEWWIPRSQQGAQAAPRRDTTPAR